MLRAGIDSYDEMCLSYNSSELPDEVDVLLDFEQESLGSLNRMCEAAALLESADLPKLAATVVFSKAECADEITEIIKNLGLFDFAPKLYTPEEYGRYMIQESGHFDYDENLEDSYDYAGYAERRIQAEQGEFNAEDSYTYIALMKATICEAIGLNGGADEVDMLQRKIDSLNRKMLALVNESVQDGGDIESHEDEFKELSETIEQLKRRIKTIQECESADGDANNRLEQIQQVIRDREKRKFQYDDAIVRQMIECIKVFADGKLEITFGGGYIVEEQLVPFEKC